MPVSQFLWSAVIVGMSFAPASVLAQGAPGPPPCSRPECRQFDFWIGSWDVTDTAGKPAGKNTIRSILNGCVLEESWTSAQGSFAGHSFNIYDAATGRWHQTWVDNSGTLLRLDGGLVGGKMVLVGSRPPAKDGAMDVLHRITWEKKSDDEVRQLWESSPDGGQTWSVVFDGKYVRHKE
jgi:Protein of unknown function (DUF1579)